MWPFFPPSMWPGFNAAMPYGYGFPPSLVPKSSPSTPEEQKVATRKAPKEGKRKRIPDGQPCLICEEPATGFHYSVPACHGCKTFFRRAIISGEGENFMCPKRSHCDVTNENRNDCRKCRLDKCLEVGMDQNAFQGTRDRRSSMVKIPVQLDTPPASPTLSREAGASQLAQQLSEIERKCNELRMKDLGECGTVSGVLSQTTWLHRLNDLENDPSTQFTTLRPATMQDVQMWNVREMRLCIEWAKALDGFLNLDEADQMCLLKNFAMPFSILNRVFYTSCDRMGKIVYPSGAYIGREPHSELRLPACKWTYDRQIDELQQPFSDLDIDLPEFPLFKAVLFFNRDAPGLSPSAKTLIHDERQKHTSALFHVMATKHGLAEGSQRHSALLLRATSLQSIVEDASANVCMMSVFEHFWKVNSFVKELCPSE